MDHSNSFSVQSISLLRNDSWSEEKLQPLIRKRASPLLSRDFKKSNSAWESPFEKSYDTYFLLEPTPIAPNRIQVVHRVDVLGSGLMNDGGYFTSCLKPLLQTQNAKKAVEPSVPCVTGSMEAAPKGLGVFGYRHQGMTALVSSDDLPRTTPSRESHLEKWSQRFRDLVEFREAFGHCLVPLEFPPNPSLAHWVKRQRCQYKAKMEGRHSTLSNERRTALEDLGFIWDSHKATWEERLTEIIRFKETHGHTNIANKHTTNPQLRAWVKVRLNQCTVFLSFSSQRQFLIHAYFLPPIVSTPAIQTLFAKQEVEHDTRTVPASIRCWLRLGPETKTTKVGIHEQLL
jgi:hypothetical protein